MKVKNTIPILNIKLSLPIKIYSLSTRCATNHHSASTATGTLPTSAWNRALPSIVVMLSGRLIYRHLVREDVRGIDKASKDAACLVYLTLISESKTNLSERLQVFKVILKSYLEQV